MEKSVTLKTLKIVEVQCQIIDERVHNVLKILRSCSICLGKINVQEI
uniref:Uncharacterized protein n=1 Tax=Arundo donax TaxID=35708 RepID=A0A0A9AAV3_ARUDO